MTKREMNRRKKRPEDEETHRREKEEGGKIRERMMEGGREGGKMENPVRQEKRDVN